MPQGQGAILTGFPEPRINRKPDDHYDSSLKNIGAVSYMGVPLMASGGKIIGNLAVLDTRPLPKEPCAEALMRIFAARAAAELQRLKAESEIQRCEEKYRRIVETTAEGFLLMDKDFVITGRFMTLFYLSIESAKRQLRWVRAGHPPAVIYAPARKEFRELEGGRLALGVDETFDYHHFMKAGLAAGQVIVVGTDGIWEACDRDGKMYGQERFRDIIRQNADLPASAILDAVYDDVNHFTLGRKRQDDMTLVVVKVEEGLGSTGDWQI